MGSTMGVAGKSGRIRGGEEEEGEANRGGSSRNILNLDGNAV